MKVLKSTILKYVWRNYQFTGGNDHFAIDLGLQDLKVESWTRLLMVELPASLTLADWSVVAGHTFVDSWYQYSKLYVVLFFF